jgi:hypothetical protein
MKLGCNWIRIALVCLSMASLPAPTRAESPPLGGQAALVDVADQLEGELDSFHEDWFRRIEKGSGFPRDTFRGKLEYAQNNCPRLTELLRPTARQSVRDPGREVRRVATELIQELEDADVSIGRILGSRSDEQMKTIRELDLPRRWKRIRSLARTLQRSLPPASH